MTSISSFAARVLPGELSDAFGALGDARTPWVSMLSDQAKPLQKSLPGDGSVTFACEPKLRSTTPRELNMYFKPTSGSYAGSVLEFNLKFPISFPGRPVFVKVKQLVYHPRCTADGTMSLKTGGTMEAACGELLRMFTAVAPDEDEKLVANRDAHKELASDRKAFDKHVVQSLTGDSIHGVEYPMNEGVITLHVLLDAFEKIARFNPGLTALVVQFLLGLEPPRTLALLRC